MHSFTWLLLHVKGGCSGSPQHYQLLGHVIGRHKYHDDI
jgi:hypothetical protein